MSSLVHYIIVREDLPLGVQAAMIAHAAGESAALYGTHNGDRFSGSTAVVLGVKNETALDKAFELLRMTGLVFESIFETATPYEDQFMAIGVVPIERERVGDKLSSLQLLRKCLDNTDGMNVSSCSSNATVETSS